jgi:hypothetical protein
MKIRWGSTHIMLKRSLSRRAVSPPIASIIQILKAL